MSSRSNHHLSIVNPPAGHLEHEPELVLLLGGAAVDAGGVQVARHLVHLVPGAWRWSRVMLDLYPRIITQGAVRSGGGGGPHKLHTRSVVPRVETETLNMGLAFEQSCIDYNMTNGSNIFVCEAYL